MNYATYVRRNALRNPRRSGLTVMSIGFSLFLLILLQAFLRVIHDPQGAGGYSGEALRLITTRSTSLFDQLPLAHQDDIEKVDHVHDVTPMQMFMCYYREEKNFLPAVGIDPEVIWTLFTEIRVTDEMAEEFASNRIAAVCAEGTMKKYDWKPGQLVTLIGSQELLELEVKILGHYMTETPETSLFLHYDYLNEARGRPNTANGFWMRSDDPDAMGQIVEDIDSMFRNTSGETRTETEKAFTVRMVSMLGNIKLLMGSIAGVVVFSMLLVSASTIAMNVRERYHEVGILKAIGYTRGRVLGLIVAEAVIIALLGGAIGCGLAWSLEFIDMYRITRGFIAKFPIGPEIYMLAIGIAAGIGFAASAWPAFRASGMTITEALRKLE